MSNATLEQISSYTRRLIKLSKKRNRKTLDEKIESLYSALYLDTKEEYIEELKEYAEEEYVEELEYKDFNRRRSKKIPVKRNSIMPMRKSQRPRRSSIR